MPEQPLHILFISSWFPTRKNPFRGNFVKRHAWAVGTQHQVSVLHVEPVAEPDQYPPFESFTKQSVLYHIYYIREAHSLIGRILKHRKRMNLYRTGLERLVREAGPVNLIHANIAYPGGWIAAQLSKSLNIPIVLTEHWTQYLPAHRHKLNRRQRHGSQVAFQNASYILPVSEDLGKAIRAFGTAQPIEAVPNVVDTKIFKPIDKTPKHQFFHLSTLRDQHKNVSGLLRAARKLRAKRTDFTLLIAGDGDPEPVRQWIREMELGDFVTLEETLQSEEVAQHMQESLGFILFSRYENLPCVISEAHACGTPVIATAVGGIPEMIDASNGLLVESEDEDGLVSAMNQLLQNQSAYKRSEIAQAAEKRYGINAVASQFSRVYQKVLASNA